jgi:hypothetical protein
MEAQVNFHISEQQYMFKKQHTKVANVQDSVTVLVRKKSEINKP